VAALQILSPDGTWRWIKHIDNALVRHLFSSLIDSLNLLQVINTGDAMGLLSGGFYKPTIHRVVQPPADQRNYTRLSVFYFCLADDDIRLVPFTESPVLKRVGIVRQCDDDVAPTMEVWRKGRTTAYGRSDLKQGKEKGVEEELIGGLVVKHYS
jgi:isopenicillin N synthase-like dioxygenase